MIEWQKELSDKMMPWEESNKYCKGLGEGWRLPTIKELIGLYNYETGQKPKCIKGGYYWSSTTPIYDSSNAWHIDFNYGCLNLVSKSNCYYVLAVRTVEVYTCIPSRPYSVTDKLQPMIVEKKIEKPVFCINCRYYDHDMCKKNPIADLVTGSYRFRDCYDMRQGTSVDDCGEEGLWHENKRK